MDNRCNSTYFQTHTGNQMKFKIELQALKTALNKSIPSILTKSTLPVFTMINVTAAEKLTFTTVNDTFHTSTVTDYEPETTGELLFPGKLFHSVIKALTGKGLVSIETNEDNHGIIIKHGKGRYKMTGINSEEFPVLENHTGTKICSVKSSDLSALIDNTAYAVSTDEFRPSMCGVLIETAGTYIRGISTDSFRLSKYTIRDIEATEDSFILPIETLTAIRKIDNPANAEYEILRTDKDIIFKTENYSLSTKAIDENFPPWESIVPADHSTTTQVSTSALINALKRVSLFASDISFIVTLAISDNELVLSTEDSELNTDASEPVECDTSGEPMTISVQHVYFNAVLSILSKYNNDTIVIKTNGAAKPLAIEPLDSDRSMSLVMPVRIR